MGSGHCDHVPAFYSKRTEGERVFPVVLLSSWAFSCLHHGESWLLCDWCTAPALQWQTGLLSRGGYVVIRDRISDCSSLFSVSSVLSTSNTETLLHQVHQTSKESSLLRVISTQVTSKLSHVLRLVDLLAFLFCARPGTNWTPLSCIGSGSHFVTAALI